MRRLSLLLLFGVLIVLVPAAASGNALPPSAKEPFTRLLCGCDLRALQSTVAAVSSRTPTVSMSIIHVFRGCHVWALRGRELGWATSITVKKGTRLRVRVDCPMDFDLVQVKGPRIALGGRRYSTGTTRVVVFKKPGLYRFRATNVQASDEIGLETLGEDNTLRLTVRVR